MGPRPIKPMVLGCIDGAQEGHSFSLGLHTTVFQAEMYAIKACIMIIQKRVTQVGMSLFSVTVRHPSRPVTASI
jgi:hypothetical protein